MKSLEMRKKFFDFFRKNDHEIVSSSSLIPAQDPTLLFTNAGMNQFKDLFLGKEKRSYTRACTIQKCVRAGGKHNDLDNVGFTKRHLTFFEMMGNFSFGDYFKKEAIQYAWDFLTKEVNIPADRLVVTVYKDDDEAFDIWHKQVGLPKDRIFRCGEKDNFWAMGDTGPCGPCSEILYDRNPASKEKVIDPNQDDVRFLEIWNNVFMQFDRQKDGSMIPLKKPGIDTGMGLERLALVLQEKDSVYETDLFTPIIEKIEELTGLNYETQPDDIRAAFRVLADHIRSSSLIIADGCMPSNEGRGYVLRKIIRRAALFEQKLCKHSIFPLLANSFIDFMGDIYPELKSSRALIIKVVTLEVEKFADNLTRGKVILDKFLEENKKSKKLTGEQAFKLYDTYGFPLELTDVVVKEHGFTIDTKAFEQFMERQRIQSGQKTPEALTISIDPATKTIFTGYEQMTTASTIIAIIQDNKMVNEVAAESECWIIPNQSPFYVERGGQAGDQGTIEIGSETIPALETKELGNAIAIKIHAPAKLKVGQNITQHVDYIRYETMKNHTATHLLQAALLKVLGSNIKQAGSLVTPDYLRFDFNYADNVSMTMMKEIEEIVNHAIWQDIPVITKQTTLEDAKKHGVIAHFGEKYNPENVRVVGIESVSAELCGGTHVKATGQIGMFKITEVTAVSAGMRRIVAVTGVKALELFQNSFKAVKGIGTLFKVQTDEVFQAVEHHLEQLKECTKKNKQLKKELFTCQLPNWLTQAKPIGSVPFLYLTIKDTAIEELREIADLLAKKADGLYVLVSSNDHGCSFVATASAPLQGKLNLPTLAKLINEKHQLRGGGNKASIQGGGTVTDPRIEETIVEWLKNQ